MAKIDTIYWSQDLTSTSRIINVSAPVGAGRGAINNKNDVLVVQALFKYIFPAWRGGKPHVGIPDSECPEPTGSFDKATAQLITKFQAKNRDKLSQDGVIHPARDGNYEWGCHKLWTIIYLNSMAVDAALMKSEDSHIQGIVKRFPQVEITLNQLIDL